MNSEFPLKITWELNKVCNLDCRICYSISKDKRGYKGLSYKKCLDVINKLRSLDVLYVFFSGGEPLLKERFYDLLSVCTSYFCTWIQTNGTMIDSESAKKISECKVNTVFVNLHSHIDIIHDNFTRTSGSFISAVNGIQNLIHANVNVMSAIILSRENFLYTREYVRLCNDLGLKKINILRGYYFNNPEEEKFIMLTNAERQYAIETMKSECDKYGIKLGHSFGDKNHNCCAQAISIDSNGILQNCPYLSDVSKLGSFLDEDPTLLWNSPKSLLIRKSYLKSPKVCLTCTEFTYCRGGCTATKYMTEKRFDLKDPVCWR